MPSLCSQQVTANELMSEPVKLVEIKCVFFSQSVEPAWHLSLQ